MDTHIAQEMLKELGSSLESLETQVNALVGFLKEAGIVTDEKLAPYLDQAGKASDVRWRAARLRLEHILSATEEQQAQEKPTEQAPTPSQQKEEQAKGGGASTVGAQNSESDQVKEKEDGPKAEDKPAEPTSESEFSHKQNKTTRKRKDEAA